MTQRSSTRSGGKAIKIVAIVLVVLLILAVVAEIVLRMVVAGQVRDGYQEENPQVNAKEDVDVSFGAVPLLFGIAGGKINEFSLRTPSTLQIEGDNVSGVPAADVDLDGVTLDDSMTADSMVVTSEIPEDYLLATIRRQIAENIPADAGPLAQYLTVTDLTANPTAGAIDVEFVNGAAVLTLTPVQKDGQLTFTASGGEILGFDLPASVTDQITQTLQDGIAGQMETSGMHIDNVEVIDGGVRTTLTGENIPLRELNEATQPAA